MASFQKKSFKHTKSVENVRKISLGTMSTLLFVLFILIIGITMGLTYSGFQSTLQSNGTMTFAVNGHSGILNLTNTKIANYQSQDLVLTFDLESNIGYTTPTISSVTMDNIALTPIDNNFKSGDIIVATYNAPTLMINRANVTGNLVIIGSSTSQTYTITYNANGGSGTMSGTDATYDSTVSLSANTFTRIGYTFTGWATASNGTMVYGDQASVKNLTTSGTYNLYAVWETNQYMISFDNQSADTNGTISVMATYGSAMPSITIPTKFGYSFNGYYTSTSGGGMQYYTAAGVSAHNMALTSNTILYASWVVNIFDITLDNANATTNGTSTIYERYGDGIYLNNNSGALSNKMTTSSNAITKPSRVYTVTLNYNYSGSVNGSLTSTYTFNGYYDSSTQMINHNGYITSNFTGTTYSGTKTLTALWDPMSVTLPTPSRTGYIFGGWYGESGCTTLIGAGGASYTPAVNKIIYAKWTASTYTISYAGMNDATYGASHPTNATYDTAFTVNNPTKNRYTFTGWDITGMDNTTHIFGNFTTTNTSISGTKETTFNNLRSTSGTVTFTATWSFDGYIVNILTDDGNLYGDDYYVLWSTVRYYSCDDVENNCSCVYGESGRTTNGINGYVSEPLRDKTTREVAKLSGIIYIYTFYDSDDSCTYEYLANLVGYNYIDRVGDMRYYYYHVYEINVTSDLNIYLYCEWNE